MVVDAGPMADGEAEDSDTQGTDPQGRWKTCDCPRSRSETRAPCPWRPC